MSKEGVGAERVLGPPFDTQSSCTNLCLLAAQCRFMLDLGWGLGYV